MSEQRLSEAQQRFVTGMAQRTGLDPLVVKAWVGTETPWGSTKANHNYLNVGPGESYSSIDQAVSRAAGLVNSSPRYEGIRASIAAGPIAQVQAIGKSPWGTEPRLLAKVYGNLRLDDLTDIGPGNLDEIPDALADTAGKAVGAAAKAIGLDKLWEQALVVGLSVVFTVAAFGLIALGLSRLTSVSPRDALGKVQSVTGVAGMARSVVR